MKNNSSKTNLQFAIILLILPLFLISVVLFAEMFIKVPTTYFFTISSIISSVGIFAVTICRRDIDILADINGKLKTNKLMVNTPYLFFQKDYRLRIYSYICFTCIPFIACFAFFYPLPDSNSYFMGLLIKSCTLIFAITVYLIFYTDRKIGLFRYEVDEMIAKELERKEKLNDGLPEVLNSIKPYDNTDPHIVNYGKLIEC